MYTYKKIKQCRNIQGKTQGKPYIHSQHFVCPFQTFCNVNTYVEPKAAPSQGPTSARSPGDGGHPLNPAPLCSHQVQPSSSMKFWVSLYLGLVPFLLQLLGLMASHLPSILYLIITGFYPLFQLRGNNSQLSVAPVVSCWCFWASSKTSISWVDEKVCLLTENTTYWFIFLLNLIGWNFWYQVTEVTNDIFIPDQLTSTLILFGDLNRKLSISWRFSDLPA